MTACKFGPCQRPVDSKGYCYHHWRQQHQGRPLTMPGRPMRGTCNFPDCGREHSAHGYCRTHMLQYVRTGETWPIGSRRNNGPGRAPVRKLEVVAECEFLAGYGEDANRVAARLGYSNKDSLYRMLSRANRLDVWRKLQDSPAIVRTHKAA